MRKILLIVFLFNLCGLVSIKAQTLSDSQNGAITICVKRACHVIVEKPNQPLHFSGHNTKRRRKHVKVISNHDWQLIVRPQAKYLENLRGHKIHRLDIEYSFENIRGDGTFTSPEPTYLLFFDPANPPNGRGTMEFDVVFELDLEECKNMRWGNYNVKVDFICVPNCFN